MGNNETWFKIMGAAKSMRRATSDLRGCPNAKALADMLRDPQRRQGFDDEDFCALADLLSGMLTPGQRGAGAKNRGIHAAERDARQYAKANRVSLDDAAAKVAKKHKVKSTEALITKLRRRQKASKTKA